MGNACCPKWVNLNIKPTNWYWFLHSFVNNSSLKGYTDTKQHLALCSTTHKIHGQRAESHNWTLFALSPNLKKLHFQHSLFKNMQNYAKHSKPKAVQTLNGSGSHKTQPTISSPWETHRGSHWNTLYSAIKTRAMMFLTLALELTMLNMSI